MAKPESTNDNNRPNSNAGNLCSPWHNAKYNIWSVPKDRSTMMKKTSCLASQSLHKGLDCTKPRGGQRWGRSAPVYNGCFSWVPHSSQLHCTLLGVGYWCRNNVIHCIVCISTVCTPAGRLFRKIVISWRIMISRRWCLGQIFESGITFRRKRRLEEQIPLDVV